MDALIQAGTCRVPWKVALISTERHVEFCKRLPWPLYEVIISLLNLLTSTCQQQLVSILERVYFISPDLDRVTECVFSF